MPFDFLKPKQKQSANAQASSRSTPTSTGRYPNDILLGDLMVKSGVISQAQLDDAIKLAGNKHLQLGQMLIMAGNISPRDLQAAVDAQSMLRDKAVDQNMASRCLKIACKTGMSFIDVVRDQEGGTKNESLSNKLGELLLSAHLIDREQFGKSMQRSLATGLPLGRILVLNGALSETLLNTALEIQVRIRDGMLTREEAIEALRGQAGEVDPEEAQRQTVKLQTVMAAAPRKKGIRLGELMVLAGLLNETDVMSALELGLVNDQPIGQVLVFQGFLTTELLDIALELQRKVDAGEIQPVEAGQALAKISATGIDIIEAVQEFIEPVEEVYEQMTFEKMITLARVVTTEDIEASLEQCTQSAQILAKVLVMTNFISDATMHAILQCYSMMSNNFLSQDDAIIALDYCLHKSADRNITFGEALQELGWSATQSLQMQAKNSVDITHIKLQAMIGPDSMQPSNPNATQDLPAYQPPELLTPEPWLPSEDGEMQSAEDYERDAQNLEGVPSEEAQPEAFQEQALQEAEQQEPAIQEGWHGDQSEEMVASTEEIAELAPVEIAQEEVLQEQVSQEEVVQGEEQYAQETQAAQPAYEQDVQEVVTQAEAEAAEIAQPQVTAEVENTRASQHMTLAEAAASELETEHEEELLQTPVGSSLSELLGQAKEHEDVIAANAEQSLQAAASGFENSQSDQQASPAAKSYDPLRDLFKPEAVAALDATESGAPAVPQLTPAMDGNAKGNGKVAHEPLPIAASVEAQPVASNGNGEHPPETAKPEELVPAGRLEEFATNEAPVEVRQLAEVTADSSMQAPKALGDLIKSISAGSAGAEAAVPSMLSQALNDARPGGATNNTAPVADSSATSLQAILAKASQTGSPPSQTPASSTGLAGLSADAVPPSTVQPGSAAGINSSISSAPTASPTSLDSLAALGAQTPTPAVPEPAPALSIEAAIPVPAPVAVPPAPVVEPQAAAVTAQPTPVAVPPAPPLAEPPAPSITPTPVAVPPSAHLDSGATADVTPIRPPMELKPGAPELLTPPAYTPPVAPAAPTQPLEANLPPAAPAAAATPAPAPAAEVVPSQSALPQSQPVAAPAAESTAVPAPIPVAAAIPVTAAQLADSIQDQTRTVPPGVIGAVNTMQTLQPYVSSGLPGEAPVEPEAQTELKEALGSALNRLAESYYEQGDYAEAQSLYERILAIKQQQLGPKHASIGADLTNLAGVLCVQGKFDQAEPFVKRVVTIIESAVPLDVLKLADSLNTLAGILFQQGKYEECEPLLGRALKHRQEALGLEHPEIADNLRDYAKLLRKLKREEEAERMYAQAKAILAKRPKDA